MRMRKRPPNTPAEQRAQEPVAADSLETVRAQATEQRQKATAARAEAEVTVSTARAQADRLVAGAEQHARELAADAAEADRRAEALDVQSAELAHIAQLRDDIADAERHVVDLAATRDSLIDQITALDGRLANLGEQREQAGITLAAARDTGDVDQVGAQRARIAAVDEVVSALTDQQQAAQCRLDAIGDPDDSGSLAEAVNRWQVLQQGLRAALNTQDPTRPEAVHDRLLAELQAALTANLDRIAEDNAPKHTFITR